MSWAGRTVLAVVPARGGSKGIALKNLRPVLGVPMVSLVGQVIADVPMIDRAVISTDHAEIVRIAEEAGIAAPFHRPLELSGDRVPMIDVVIHALRETERHDGKTYDIVVVLQPTSPLRTPLHVAAAIETLVREDWDAVWTVSETDSKSHPLKQLVIQDGRLSYYDERGAQVIARQQLEPIYHRNGVANAFTRACLLEQRTLMGARTGALILDGRFVSIDTEWDVALAELLMAQKFPERGTGPEAGPR